MNEIRKKLLEVGVSLAYSTQIGTFPKSSLAIFMKNL